MWAVPSGLRATIKPLYWVPNGTSSENDSGSLEAFLTLLSCVSSVMYLSFDFSRKVRVWTDVFDFSGVCDKNANVDGWATSYVVSMFWKTEPSLGEIDAKWILYASAVGDIPAMYTALSVANS